MLTRPGHGRRALMREFRSPVARQSPCRRFSGSAVACRRPCGLKYSQSCVADLGLGAASNFISVALPIWGSAVACRRPCGLKYSQSCVADLGLGAASNFISVALPIWGSAVACRRPCGLKIHQSRLREAMFVLRRVPWGRALASHAMSHRLAINRDGHEEVDPHCRVYVRRPHA